MGSNKEGKIFEESIEESANKQNIFCFRVRDVNPMALKNNFSIPKNKYDFLLFNGERLITAELKSAKGKSFSFDGKNPKIKPHQVKALTKASNSKNVHAGLILNFRECENRTFYIPINRFNTYTNIAVNGLEHTYNSRVNKSSIPFGICEEIGIEIKQHKRVSRYAYLLNKLFEEI
ncbi:hypothetical protein [Oceanobacillus kimchii]|uniref:NERD domain-containing protein n=1 Tax=Oceanobacillus kimchii TaxID=746691 RepID=A0ABQ5THD5_9BACI|nr:hypothetical protein [Oceanobacillus kimchii]GLO66288.1 hypothetical protein MACH08_20720 [Oceanobacillus kimchii]